MRTLNSHFISSQAADSGAGLAVPAAQVPLYIAAGTLSASFDSPPFKTDTLKNFSYIIESTNVVGSGSLQVSNDPGNEVTKTGIVNWVTLSTTSTAISGTVAVTSNLIDQAFKWARFHWVHTSGTGSMDMYVNGMGF